MLFDTPKDTVFAEIWVFSNIFVVFLKYLKTKILGFLNWAANWTKTVNFACVSFEVILNILKDFSNAVFALLETTSGQKISARLNNILGCKGPKKPKRSHFMDAESVPKTLKIFNFTKIRYILITYFIWQNLGS